MTKYRNCLTNGNVIAARVLLNQSKDKSSILNEKDDHDNTVLVCSLWSKTDECLKYIINELAEDHARTKESALNGSGTPRSDKSRESSYSRRSQSHSMAYRSDDYNMKAISLFDHDDSNTNIHPMYFITANDGSNIFHTLMSRPDSAQSKLAVLEGVLEEDQIQKLLTTPNQEDKLPLQVISRDIDNEALQWVLVCDTR